MTTHTPDLAPAVLEVLRRHTGNPALRYAEPPALVAGGFWADILAVRLEGAPPGLDGDLIVRVMPEDDAARREIVVHTQVAAQGFPAPAVRVTGDATAGLGRPFIVMDRAPGRPLIPELGAASLLAHIPSIVRMPVRLARVAARLHALDPAPLRAAFAAAGEDRLVEVDGLLDRMTIWTSEFGRDELASAVERLRMRRPPRRREVVCHGDLQPFNVLVHRGRVTVIDWTAALVAEPAYDLAYTTLTMSLAPVDAPRPVQAAAAAGGRAFARRFLRVYRGLAGEDGLEQDTFAWYTALQTLRSLLDGARNLAADAPHPFIAAAPLLQARLTAYLDAS